MKSYGERLHKCGTQQLSRETASGLSTGLREALEPLLQEVESLNERIQEYDRRIHFMPQSRQQSAHPRGMPGFGVCQELFTES